MEVAEPVTVARSYTQKIHASPEEVFPLLCPVREAEWVPGWDPLVVFTQSGLMEQDCIFLTGEDGPESFWVTTRHDRRNLQLELVKVTPGMTIGKISIALKANGDEGTDLEVTYRYTAVSQAGQDFVDGYSEDYFVQFMRQWEKALNDYMEIRKSEKSGPVQQEGEN